MNLSISEQLCYSTIRIECFNSKGQGSTGTSFIFNYKLDENQSIPIIITNKHVIQDMEFAQFIMTQSDNLGNPINTKHFPVRLQINNFVRMHPDDDIDLCAFPLVPILEHAKQNNVNLFFKNFDQTLIPNSAQLNELNALESIIMIGYPNGIWDSVNNMPILRKGSTATHPCLNYNGKKEFMIDAACFPGSSGSPVLILNTNGYSTKSGTFMMGQPRILLLGVLYGGPQHIATGDIRIMALPTDPKPISISQIPNNLGNVIKSEKILDLVNLFK
ncbi:MAG TPA: serine protease [Flavobacteriaceae bacterium]|nr:serine protease [Flavobacteriaceae bacterium]